MIFNIKKIYLLIFLFHAMAITISAALAFEYIGGYVPCYLCLQQRLAYYFSLIILLFGFIIYFFYEKKIVLKNFILNICLLFCLVAMLINFALATYHSGVEWGFFAGPNACLAVSGSDNSDASNLLAELALAKPPACNEASWRFFGLSFAGWNAAISLLLAIIAFLPFIKNYKNKHFIN